jgi:mono/diheme cytochrome c family protein
MRHWRKTAAVLVAAGGVVALAASGATAQAKGDAAAGKALFESAKCVTCHGDSGKGDGPMGQKLKDKPSSWAGGGGLKALDDQKIYDSIAKGGAAIGKSKAMPAAPKLSEAEVWNLVAYVKSLAK